jgi:hypothetical protein
MYPLYAWGHVSIIRLRPRASLMCNKRWMSSIDRFCKYCSHNLFVAPNKFLNDSLVLSVSSLYNYCYDTSYKLCQSSFKILYPFLLTPTIRSFEMLSHDRIVILLWLESYFRRIDNQCGFVSSPRLTVFNPPWVEKRGVSSLLNIDCTYVTTIHLNPIKLSWVCWLRWKLGFDTGKVRGSKVDNLPI